MSQNSEYFTEHFMFEIGEKRQQTAEVHISYTAVDTEELHGYFFHISVLNVFWVLAPRL